MPSPTRAARSEPARTAGPEVRTSGQLDQIHSHTDLIHALVNMRRLLGLSQTQLANFMGVKQPTVSGFETEGSDPRLSTLIRYADAVDAVLGWSLQPRHRDHPPVPYVDIGEVVSTATNKREPSRRALAWKARKPYTRLGDVA